MNIEVDFDVFKVLTARRSSEDVTHNEVLRELLGLSPKKSRSGPIDFASGHGDWVTKGVRFPSGTEFRARYKGKTYYGKVESGALLVGNKRFDSPSAAAGAITGNSVNGWLFWECRIPGMESWQMLTSLKK